MDVLSLFTIPVKGLSAGNHRFEFDVDGRFFDAFGTSLVTGGWARVEVDAHKATAGLSLDFNIKGEAEVQCDRCLEFLTLPVEYQGTLTVRTGQGGEYDGEVMWIGAGEDTVNVAQYIYESICLSLPLSRVHPDDENGRSTCDPDMLGRFMIVSQEEFDSIAQQNDGQDRFKEKLGEIKKDLE